MAETNPFADPNYGLEPGAQENPFSNPDYGKDTDGPLARGWKKSKQSIAISRDLTTGDVDSATQNIAEAERYARANPGLPEGRELSQAWDRGEGISGGVKEVAGEIKKDWDESSNWVGGLRATGRNLRAMGEGVIEQAPNMVAPVTGMIAGGAAGAKVGGALGSVVPGAGTAAGAAVGGFAGGWAGASAGNAAIEGGYMAQEALQKAGIDPQDTQAVRQFLLERGDSIMGDAAVKGGIIGAVDAVTFGVAGRLLNGPARAAASRALADMGVDTANSAAVKAAMQTPQFAQRIAGDAVYQASRTGAQNVARNVGAAALEPAGEFAGEYLGQGVATGEWDAKNAALEAFSSIGQSGAMFAGQKAYQYVTRPRSAQGEQTPPEAGTAPPAGPQGFAPTAERPVIDEAALGRAGVYPPAPAPIINERALEPAAPTPSQQIFTPTAERPVIDEAALGRAGVYPPAPAPIINERALEPAAPTPSQQMGLDPAAGPMSAAAALAVDTGASATMQQAAQAVDPAPAIDVSGRTDEQLRVLEKAGRDGWREAAVAEIQRRATQQQAETPAPAVEPAAQAAVEQQAPTDIAQAPAEAAPVADIKDMLAKQIPDMTDGELQQAIAHYGPAHKRTAKLQKELQKREQGAQPAQTPAAPEQSAAADPSAEVRRQLREVEDKILAAAPSAMGAGGGDIEAAMKSRKVPVTLKAQRKRLKEQLRQASQGEQAQNVQPAQVDAASGQGSGAVPAGSAGVAPGRPVDIGRVDRPAGAPAPGSRARVPVGTAGVQQPAGVEGATDTTAPVAQPAAPQGAQTANVPPTEQVAPQAQEAGGQEGEAAGEKAAGVAQAQSKPFDPVAWDKARANTVQASRDAGNKHLDTVPAYVETMRGYTVYDVHNPQDRGVIDTVDNSGFVYVVRKDGSRNLLSPSDLKDYALTQDARLDGKALNALRNAAKKREATEAAKTEADRRAKAVAEVADLEAKAREMRPLLDRALSGTAAQQEAAQAYLDGQIDEDDFRAEMGGAVPAQPQQPQATQAPTTPEQSRPAPSQRSESAQPSEAIPPATSEGWDGMTAEQRAAVLTKPGGWSTAKGKLNVIGKQIAGRNWSAINPTTRATIERLMQGEQTANVPPTEQVAPQAQEARGQEGEADGENQALELVRELRARFAATPKDIPIAGARIQKGGGSLPGGFEDSLWRVVLANGQTYGGGYRTRAEAERVMERGTVSNPEYSANEDALNAAIDRLAQIKGRANGVTTGGQEGAGSESAGAEGAAGGVTAPADAFDVSGRTDAQLRVLVESGKPGWREAAIAEVARREAVAAEQPAQAPTAPEQSRPAPGQRSEPAQPIQQPQAIQQDTQADAPEFTTLKDRDGKTVTVRTADLSSTRERMPTFTKEGKRRTAWIHRDNLDPTGEKQAEGAKEMANNPLFNVITTKDGGAFAIKAAASRELNARGLAETHEVVPAGDVQAGLKGYLVRKKAEAPAASSFPEQAGAEGGDEEAMQVRRYQQKTDQWNSRVKKFGLQKIIEEARSAVAGHVLGREFGEAVEDFYKRDAAARATRDWLAAKEAAPSRATTKDERKPAEQQQPGATTPAWRTVKSAPFADQASAVLALMNAAQKPSQSEEVVKAVRALARSAEESGDATARGIATFIADNALEALASHKINAGRGSVVEKARHKKLKDGIERLRSLEVERVTRGDESPATAAPQATHKDPGQPAEPAQQQEKAADTQAAAERTEYPFGEVPTNQESKFFRSRVRVLPEMRGDTAWDGEVGSILNGGRLLEVTRDGRDFSVRVRGERIEVLERVENGIKESEVKFDASVNDRWSSIVAATNEESGAQRSVQALARFAGATGEPVNDVWGRWRDFIGATELAGRTGEQVVRWMESNLISEPWDDRAIPGNDVNGSMGSTPDYWRSKLADYERAMTAFNEADARMDQQTFDVERVDGSPERTKAAREILSGMRKKAAENGEYIRKKVQEAEKNEAEETARAEEDRLSRFKPFDAGLASKKPSVASITGWFAGTWSNGANTAWSDGSIADLYGEPHLKGWETRKANKRTTPDVDRVIPRNSNDPLEPVGMYDSKVGQTKGVMYYQMGDSVLPFALHYVQYFMSKYKGAKLVGNLNTPSGPAAVVHEGRTVGVIMPMRVNQVTAEELRENIAKGEKITQQREKADPTAQERTEQPAAEATAHPPAANQPALTGPRRNPTQVSAFAPYAAGDIVALDGQDWQVQQDMGGWYLTSTGNWRGMHPTIQKIRGMNELIAEIERAATAQPATAEQGDAPAGTEATAADLMTPEQARALMVWEDLGQRDNVKSMRLAFFESAERMAAKRGAMNYGTIESYQGGKWNIDGTTYPTLKAAKAAAEEAALVRLANDGYVAQPFAAYDAVARTYGYEVRADGAIGSEGKFPGPTIKEKGGRLRVESGKGDLLGSYPATPESLGRFLESFWGAEKQAAQPASGQPTSDRDQFTVERVDEDQRQTLTFGRGETVKVSGKYPMETGQIDGISNARKEFRIGGAWLPFGYAYKAEYDEFAAPRRELEEMIANAEKRIADGNGFQRDGYPIRDAREHAKRYSLKGYEDTLNDLAKRGQATFDRRIAEDSARIAAAKQADRERREAADAADAAKYAGPVKMTMDEWKRIGRDFKSFNGGNRTVMQDGRIRRVEIVKEKAEAPEGSFMDPSLPVQTGVNARMVVIDRPAVDDGVLRPGDADPEVAFSATLPRDRNAVRIGITEKGLVRAMRLQFDGLADVTSKLLERGRSGKRGGVIVVSTADNAEIGRIVAERTGRKLDSTMRKFSSAGRLNGFYDPKTGLTFLVAPNLNPVTATAVMLHEMMHGQQRQKIDARALEMVRNRHGLKDEGLRAFLDRVMLRMIAAGEVGNAAEASAYIVEQAVIEGRSAGYTFADNAFMQWVDAKIGKRVGDFLRSFAGMIRTWMLRNGLGAKAMTVDDFVGYAMAGLDRAAAGEVRGRANAQASIGSRAPQSEAFRRWFGDSKVVDERGQPLVVYHGTQGDFDVFVDKDDRQGFYFAEQPEYANLFAEGYDANVMPAYLSVKNPAEMSDGVSADLYRQISEAGYSRTGDLLTYRPEEYWELFDGDAELRDVLQSIGFDGVKLTEPPHNGEQFTAWLAFRPSQIKSAVGNNGDYDPDNDNILFSRSVGDAPAQEAQRVQSAIEGKTLIEAAQFMTRSKDGAKAAVAQKVLEKLQRLEKAGVALDLKIAHRGDMAPASMVNARGYTETGFDEKGRDIVVWLNGADVTGKVGTEEEVLLHELVHAATAGMVFYGTQTPDSLAGKHARDLMAVTDAIAEHIRKRFDAADAGKETLTEFEQDMRDGANNAFRSDDEVLAWALSNSEAQAYLETIPYRSGSMWSNFVQAVRNLLGLGARNDTALSEVLRVAERILTDDAPAAGRAAFWHKRNIRMAQQQVRGSIVQTAERGADDLQFSRSGLRELASRATAELNNTLTAPGKLSWWHKTVGTMYNLAERAPAFKPVFRSAQGFIDDVSHYAADAAERAPRLLPRLDTWRDILKSPISAEDNAAVGKPIFEGTLSWTRDADGRPVRVDALIEVAADMSVEEMAAELVRRGAIEARTLRMWRGMADAQYESAIRTRYENAFLQPGIVWTDSELASMFSLTPAQTALYREFRAAVDRSLDTMARADMLRFAGEDVRFLRDPVMEAPTLRDAASLIVASLNEQANASPDRATQLMATGQGITDRMQKVMKLQAQGYAPLSRFGKYTVDVVVDGNREYFGLFETARDANKMAKRMREEFGAGAVTQGTLSDEAYKLFAGITPESLELFGNMLGLDSTGDEAQDRAFQEYLRLTKTNRSALRRLIHRKGIAGFSEDVSRVLASFAYSNARQTAAGLHMGDLSQAVSDIPKEQGELKDVAVKLSEYIKNPQEEAQAIRGLLFAQYLGGSVASAFVNMTQPAAVTFPWLSQHGGAKMAAAEIGKAAKHIATRGHRYEPDLAEALKAAEEDGVVSPQEVHQLMAQARGSGSLKAGDGTRAGNALAMASNSITRLSAAWGKLFSAAEQLNRRITFIAAYRVASQQRMANPAEFARRAVTETQFVYSKASKMQWGRGAVGGTLMTFKTYSVAYMELMSRLWSQGAPGSAERKSGRKAVALMLAMVLLMGGGGGLPFMEDAEDLIDGIAQIAGYNVSTKKARQQFLIDAFGADAADFIERGVSGLPGVPLDVSGRLGLGNLIPGTGIFLDRSNHTRDVLELLGPVGDLGNRIVTGARKALSGDLGGAALDVSPVAVRNVAKGVDMAVMDQYRDTRGRKVLDTTDLEAALKAIGFQPASVAKVQDANYLNQRAKDFYSLSADRISATWAAGIYEKDSDKVQEARDMIAQWNADNPDQPMMIRMPNILRRVREMGKDKAQRIADTAPRAMRQQLREELLRQ
jgi:hypothetical protein